MRKKTIYVLATVMCMSIFTACGSTNRADAGNEVQQEVQAEDNMQKEQSYRLKLYRKIQLKR